MNYSDNYISPNAGVYRARFFQFIDLGTKQLPWKTKPTRSFHLSFEILDDRLKEGQANIVSAFFDLNSLHKFFCYLEVFQDRMPSHTKDNILSVIEKYLGDYCMVMIGYKPRYNNDDLDYTPKLEPLDFYGLSDDVMMPNGSRDLFFFSFETFDWITFEYLSDGMKSLVMQSDEYKAECELGIDTLSD